LRLVYTFFFFGAVVMGDLVPGGYTLIHFVFWTLIAMIAVGTNAVAIMLTFGFNILLLETFKKEK